jgi:hypothetical protein
MVMLYNLHHYFKQQTLVSREVVMEAIEHDGWALQVASLFQKEYEFYGRILDFKGLKKRRCGELLA